MTFEGYWVVHKCGDSELPCLESIAHNAIACEKRFTAFKNAMGQGNVTWEQWEAMGFSIWPVTAGSVEPSLD